LVRGAFGVPTPARPVTSFLQILATLELSLAALTPKRIVLVRFNSYDGDFRPQSDLNSADKLNLGCFDLAFMYPPMKRIISDPQ
jgi:hypothetical protein